MKNRTAVNGEVVNRNPCSAQDANRIFDAIENVLTILNQRGRRKFKERLGFLDGDLVHFDGKTVTAITASDSIRKYFEMELLAYSEHHSDIDSDISAKLHWFELALKELKP